MADVLVEEPPAMPGRSRVGRARAGLRRTAPLVAGAALMLVALLVYGALVPGQRALTSSDVNSQIAQALASQTPPPPISEQVYAAVRPSLVLIQSTFTPDPTTGKARSGLGSGVVVDDGGDILTALHVVDGATSVVLTFADGTQSGAQVTATEPDNDIAVLRPDAPPANLVPVTLGNPGAMRVGSQAFVLGNPFGLYASESSGIVSGLDRSFQMPGGGNRVLHGLIQVDAAVNPGNSGGPLLNGDGQLVGIITALVNPTKEDVFIGIGLAVPIDVAGGAAGLPQY